MAGDKKETIRTAAISVIARNGFHGATTDAIAERACVAVGTLYNYFRSKDEILSYIFEMECGKRRSHFEKLISNEQMGALEKIESALRFHFGEMLKNPDLAVILAREKNLPCRSHGGASQFRGLASYLAEMLRDGMERDQLRPHDAEIIASCLMGAVDAVVVSFVLEPDKARGRLEKTISEVLDLLRYGMKGSATEVQS